MVRCGACSRAGASVFQIGCGTGHVLGGLGEFGEAVGIRGSGAGMTSPSAIAGATSPRGSVASSKTLAIGWST